MTPQRAVADVPGIGEDVTHLMAGVPGIGEDVTHLMGDDDAALYDPNRKPASAEDFLPAPPTGSSAARFVGNALDALNPITAIEGVATALRHPVDTVSRIAEQQYGEAQKAAALLRDGRYEEAAGHGAAAVLPILGPAAAAAGEQIGSGDIAGGLGKASGLLAPIAVGALAPADVKVPGVLAPASADVADAAALAERAGVPLDVATASGNRFAKAAQHLADRSLGGGLVADKAIEAQKAGLATLGEQLAAKGYNSPVTAEQAGDAVRAGVLKQVEGNAGLANDAYDVLRKIEADPTNASVVPGPDGSTQLVPLPVDLRPAQKALAPLYDELSRQRDLAPASIVGDKATALGALDKIVNGPTHAPLSTVDAVLGDLKRFARGGAAGDVPALATPGQAAAKQAIANLDGLVQRTAAEAGPDALAALKEGRAATVAKYQAADVLDSLNAEPERTVKSLIGGGNIAKLRSIADQAPDVLPQVGRAHLDNLLSMEPDKAFAEWGKTGAASKQILYGDPGYVKDLDDFFRLRKMVASNPNPSGTAHTIATYGQAGLMIQAPWIGVPLQVGTAALSKLMHSDAGVRLLTKGLRIPIGNKAAGAAWLADLTAATNSKDRIGPATVSEDTNLIDPPL